MSGPLHRGRHPLYSQMLDELEKFARYKRASSFCLRASVTKGKSFTTMPPAAAMSEGLVQRKRRTQKEDEFGGSGSPNVGNNSDDERSKDADDGDSKETRLTLMEEVLLLGLKDKVSLSLNCLFFCLAEALKTKLWCLSLASLYGLA